MTERPANSEIVVPVVAEILRVEVTPVETGSVHITKTVEEWQETIPLVTIEENVTVTRVPVDRMVSHPVAIRQEGDTTIFPIFEERMVVEKRLFLKEEIHVTRQTVRAESQHTETLRRETAHVQRIYNNGGGDADARQTNNPNPSPNEAAIESQ